MNHREVHISSLIVHVRPARLDEMKVQISRIKGAEIYGDAKEGKIVVVLETVGQKYITDIIGTINNLEDVLNTSLVYHHIEHLGPSREEDL